jgi:ribonuclease HII
VRDDDGRGGGVPTLRIEKKARREAGVELAIVGLDEAGRGPLAGPVVAAAVVFSVKGPPRRLASAIDDSKKLPRAERERLAPLIMQHAIVGIGRADVAEIDHLNILRASLLAMARAVRALGVVPDLALVDGNIAPEDLPCPARTVIGGDAASLSIAAASIIAKVTRDRLMIELAATHPTYGWERNAGYATPEHCAALKQWGPTPEHRKSFRPVYQQLSLEL